MVIIYTILVSVASKLASIIAQYIIVTIKKIGGNKKPGSYFDIPIEIVWCFTIQLQLNFVILYYPSTVLIAPLINYLVFKAYRFKLLKNSLRPDVNSQDESTAVYLYGIQLFTYSLVFIYTIILSIIKFKEDFWVSDPERLCGPIH